MISMTHLPQPPSSLNGFGSGLMDGSGTINPAALNAAGSGYQSMLPPTPSSAAPTSGSRGQKRSRSPDDFDDVLGGDGDLDDEARRRRRGRAPVKGKIPESPVSTTAQHSSIVPPAVQTPQITAQSLPQASPASASPPRATPTKGAVVKALPTVRDHTTDQLNPEGDEYLPREFDEAGERKVSPTGHLQEGREYRCRTFFVPNRGDKLFMLATECARVLGYRDSYLLFNKNRSLYKIIATQEEKDDLIQQEILPYSYRSRQIAIVTARSMFRQFGSRVIVNGRRVRDDYWESKARKQGFTEEDAAGEKRPGAARAREAAAAAGFAHANLVAMPQGQVVYNGAMDARPPLPEGVHPVTLATTSSTLPMIDERRPREYVNVPRPRQEITGPPYQDRTQSSPTTEILNQAAHAADFNKLLVGQQKIRKAYLEEVWSRPLDPSYIAAQRQSSLDAEKDATASQAVNSPRQSVAPPITGMPQQSMPQQQQQQHPTSMMTPQHFPQQGAAQMPMQSPARPTPQQQMRPSPLHHSSMGMQSPGQHPGYGYSQNMYMQQQQHQGQPSPLHQTHNVQQYSHPSPHTQPSALRGPPQMQPGQHGAQMQGMAYQNMGYQGMPQGYQPSPSPAQQQFMPQTSGSQQAGMPQWPQHGGIGQQQQGWGQGY